MCSDSNSDVTSAMEIADSGTNLVSDRTVVFSRNLRCALADFYGRYLTRDLHVLHHQILHTRQRDVLCSRQPMMTYTCKHAVAGNIACAARWHQMNSSSICLH